MDVDDPRRHHAVAGVDDAPRPAEIETDGNDPSPRDADICSTPRSTGAVDELSASDDRIEFHGT
jgi:hypothetical protein